MKKTTRRNRGVGRLDDAIAAFMGTGMSAERAETAAAEALGMLPRAKPVRPPEEQNVGVAMKAVIDSLALGTK